VENEENISDKEDNNSDPEQKSLHDFSVVNLIFFLTSLDQHSIDIFILPKLC